MNASGDDGGKADGAMLSIGELASRIGVPTHILRYWETRFPELNPLQRSGRRRYYRVGDVALAERIYDLLHVRGFTVDGARKALSDVNRESPPATGQAGAVSVQPGPSAQTVRIDALVGLRQRLANALQG